MSVKLRIPTPVGAIEERRTISGKRFRLPNGQRRFIAKVGVVHVPDNVRAWARGESVNWQEPDVAVRLVGNRYEVGNAWYTVTFDPTLMQMDYRSKAGGRVMTMLRAVHEPTIPLSQLNRSPIVRHENELWLDDLAPDMDFFIRFGVVGVRLYLRLKSAAAPHDVEWEREYDDLSRITVRDSTVAFDNVDLMVDRPGPAGNRRRRLEMIDTKGPEQTRGVGHAYNLRKRFNRRVREHDLLTGDRWQSAVAYPVVININETEQVPSDRDDGAELGTDNTWDYEYGTSDSHVVQDYTGNLDWYPGARFTNVDVDQGSTISAATLTFITTSSAGGNEVTATISGSDEDDATVWPTDGGTGDTPSQMTKTTANVDETSIGQSETHTPSVQGIVDEIVSRGGWASGNAMKFGFHPTSGGNGYTYIEDHGGATNANRMQLDITFTPPAGGNPKGVLGGLVFAGPMGGPTG